jgi:acetyl-CoA acetyltransferase
MGIGPIAAIPKALKQAGLTKDQLDGSNSTRPSPRRHWP